MLIKKYVNMKLNKYQEYISEKVIYDLILESKVVFSKKFINLLSMMDSNKLAKELLNLYSKDINVTQNYIDITDEKDAVSFTPDRKVQELTKDIPEIYTVVESGKYLTHGDANLPVFKRLGYEREGRENWAPDIGTVGVILSETLSKSTRNPGRIYVLFQEYNTENPRLAVLNKEALQLGGDVDEFRAIWTTARNPIKIGRLVRAILTVAKIPFTAKDIEDFTNQYKSTYDISKDAFKKFDIVSGSDIAYWYSADHYVPGGGTLNNSCMAHSDSNYFDIYSRNKQVKLVILYGDNGTLTPEGDFKSNKIKGRALLWELTMDGSPVTFMDRIYTVNDSDTDLFKEFAQQNGWWYKSRQSMEQDEDFTDGKTTKRALLVADLDKTDFDKYPYTDTLSFINTNDDTASNRAEDYNRVLRDTSGGWEDEDGNSYGDDYYDDDDY